MIKKKANRGTGKTVYFIMVDGQTEKWYFRKMKEHESLPRIDIRPELGKKKKLIEQYESVKENAKHYDKVVWIFDFDTILKENKETKNTERSKIQEFKEYKTELEKLDNVIVLVNVPCLEFWYLLHFKETGKYYSNCESVIEVLKKQEILKNYEKSEKFNLKHNDDIYKKLKPFQSIAIKNAKKLGSFNFENTETAAAEIYKLFEYLGIDPQN